MGHKVSPLQRRRDLRYLAPTGVSPPWRDMSALVRSALPNESNEGKGYHLCMPGLGQGIWLRPQTCIEKRGGANKIRQGFYALKFKF